MPAMRIPGATHDLNPIFTLKSFERLLSGYTTLFRDGMEAYGPVFRLNVGINCVAITELAPAERVMSAETTLVDRLPRNGFGPMMLNPALIKIWPTLTSSGERWSQSRPFLKAWIEHRSVALPEVASPIIEAHIDDWVTRGSVELRTELSGLCNEIYGTWLCGAAFPYRDWLDTTENMLEPGTSSRLGNLLLSLLKPTPRGAPAVADRMIDQMRVGTLKDEIAAVGSAHGLELDDALRQVRFMSIFNATGGSRGVLFPLLVTVTNQTDLRDRLRGELGGHDLAPMDVTELPLLRAVFREGIRMFSGPPFFFRVARRDFELETSTGKFEIGRGEVLCIPSHIVQRDPRVFANPDAFDPDRFLRTPELAERLVGEGSPLRGPQPYSCLGGMTGVSERVVGVALARIVQELDWTLEPAARLQWEDGLNNWVEPVDVRMVNIARRR